MKRKNKRKNKRYSQKINPRGFWEGERINHHYDESLSKTLNSIVADYNTFVDFGCGDAKYAKYIKENNPLIEVEAYDGNPDVESITDGFGKVLDLSKTFDLNKKYDVVCSLEVAEHIPKEYEKIYIENLLRHCSNLLIISWAKKGQIGYGHVNNQNQDYVIDVMEEYGLTYDNELSETLQKSSTNCSWFRDSVMVFSLK